MAAVAAASGSEQVAAPEPIPAPAPACPRATLDPQLFMVALGDSKLLKHLLQPKDDKREECPRATLDPQLLMAARRGDSEALKELLQLKDDDGNDDQQGQDTRPDDEGSGTPTTGTAAAASTTTFTSVAAAPSISQPHVVLEVDPRRPHADAVAAAPLPRPPVPVIEGTVEQVVKQPPPHDDDAAALPAPQPPAAPPAAGSSAVVPVVFDEVTMEGDSLLHVVAAGGDTKNFLDCVRVIVKKKGGAGDATTRALAKCRALKARNNKGDTPLHCAARAGNANMIGCLVDRLTEAVATEVKTFLERKNKCGETELQQAVSAVTKAAVKAFVTRKNNCGETALHQAVRAASKAAIGKLLAVDPELAACSRKEDDAGAASKAAIGELLAVDPELAACSREENDAAAAAACSPFYLAVSLWGEDDGEMDIASYLFHETEPSIRSGLSYYCSGPDGRNVLHAAVSRASVKTVILLSQLLMSGSEEREGRLLLSQLASQRDKKNGSTPLHLAASLLGLPSSYLVFPPQVGPPKPETTPLWPSSSTDAASKSAHRLVGRLILGGSRYWQILPLMLSLVLNANVAMAYQPDKAGMYPIHVAAGSGSLRAVEMLLERCPDCTTLRDAKGRTLLHVAAEEGRFFVVNYVCRQSQLKLSRWPARRPGARLAGLLSSILNAQDMSGDTPLHRAVHAAQLRVVRRLIRNQQVRLDVPNNKGMRPIDVSWTTLPREAYYAWDSRMRIRRSLLRLGAPYGENNRGDLFRKNQDEDEKKMSENLTAAAQILALFSVLITTVTFASAFTLPGGSRSAGDAASVGGVAGTPVLGGPRRSYAFEAFILADALAFGLSLLATSTLLYAGVPAGSLDDRFRLLNFAYGLMWQSGRSLLAAFGLGLFIVLLPVARSIAIAVAVIMILLARATLKRSEFEGLSSLGDIGIGRFSRRQVSPRDRVLGCILFVFNYFWSYVLIFGIPAIRRWPRFTLSPY